MVAYRIPDHVGRVDDPNGSRETVYVAPLPDGPIVVLRDTALTIWREAVAPSGPGLLAERVAAAYRLSAGEVEHDVVDTVRGLIEMGVLEVVTD